MIKVIITILLLMSSTQLWGAQSQQGFKIDTHFEFKNSDKDIKAQSTFILAKDNNTWTTLTEPEEGVVLLGRVVKSEKKSLHIEYIVIDTTQSPAVISTPAFVANLGERAEITAGSKADQKKVAISLLATETEYTNKK